MGFGKYYRLLILAALTAGAVYLALSRGGQAPWFLAWLLGGISLSALAVFLFNLMSAEVVRQVGDYAVASGDFLQVELAVKHLSLLPVAWMSVSDRFVRKSDGEEFAVTKLVFPGFTRKFTVRYGMSGLTRGEYRFTGTELAAGDWWGLAVKRRRLPASGEFAVLPDARPVLPSSLPPGRGEEEPGALYRFGPSAAGQTVREYVTGDPLHRIHWKSTARLGDLMTRVMEPAEELKYMVCLDAAQSSCKGAAGARLFEQGAEWAAGFMQAAAENRCAAGLAANNREELWLAPAACPDSAKAMLLLAGLSPNGGAPLAELLLGRVKERISGSYAIVVITPSCSEDTAEALLELRKLNRQVLLYQVLGNRSATLEEREQKRRLELAGCIVRQVQDARRERAVRLHAEYAGA